MPEVWRKISRAMGALMPPGQRARKVMTETDILCDLEQKTLIPVCVLQVSSDLGLQADFRRILGRTNWKLYQANNAEEAVSLLTRNPVSVLVSDTSIPIGRWLRIFEEVGRTVTAPRCVACVPAETRDVWTEAVCAGADDVIGVPYDPKEVYSVISNAHLAWLNPAFRSAEWGQHDALPSVA